MVKEIASTFKTYPVIGMHSTEQTRFLRHDPMPYTEFEHVIEERKRYEMVREIFYSLIAVISLILALSFSWNMINFLEFVL